MASMTSRRILNKFQSQFFYQIKRNFSPITHSNNIHIKFGLSNQMLLRSSCFNLCQMAIRQATSSNLSIKKYQPSLKYTGYWKVERLLGWSLVLMIPTAFAIESKELEMALGTVTLTHTYLGCQSMCSDYLRSGVVGKVLPIIVRLLIVFISLSSLAGIYQLVYADIGIVNMIKKFWGIRGRDYLPPTKFTKN